MVLGETTSLEASLQLAGAQFLPWAWLEMNQLLRPSAGQMWGGERAGGRPLEGRGVLAFEGLFVAGIGGSDPLVNWRGGRRDAGRRSRGPADAATPRSEWQEPRLEAGGYWGDALFANFESCFGCLGGFRSHSTKHAFGSA